MIFSYAEMGNDDYEGEQYSWKDWVKNGIKTIHGD